MPLDSARFLRAQDPVWASVVAELTLGRKQTHWMWFVFPQLRGLGKSETSTFFGLETAADALDYMSHPLLGERLTEVCGLVRRHAGKPVEDVFGPVDSRKLQSSMTLFETTPQLSVCAKGIIDEFFAGQPCAKTQARMTPPEPLLVGQ